MFLDRLIERTLGEAPAIAPRRASRFEPAGAEAEPNPQPIDAVKPHIATPPSETAQTVVEPRVFHYVEQVQPAAPGHNEPVQPPPIVPREVRAFEVEQPVPQQTAHLSPRADAPQSQAAPPQPVTALVERRTESLHASPETIVRERFERTVETQTIERQLEQLRESRVDHIEHVETRIERLPPAEKAHAPAVPEARPNPALIIPDVRQQPAPRPAIMQPRSTRVELAPAPTIQVTIGRVEVRTSPPATRESAKSQSREPKLGLEEYLQRRERA